MGKPTATKRIFKVAVTNPLCIQHRPRPDAPNILQEFAAVISELPRDNLQGLLTCGFNSMQAWIKKGSAALVLIFEGGSATDYTNIAVMSCAFSATPCILLSVSADAPAVSLLRQVLRCKHVNTVTISTAASSSELLWRFVQTYAHTEAGRTLDTIYREFISAPAKFVVYSAKQPQH